MNYNRYKYHFGRKIGIMTTFIIRYLGYFIRYMLFGFLMLGLFAATFCLLFPDTLTLLRGDDASGFLLAFSERVNTIIPLGEMLKGVFGENVSLLGAFVDFFYSMKTPEVFKGTLKEAFVAYTPSLLKDLAVLAVAGYTIPFFTELKNKYFKDVKSILFKYIMPTWVMVLSIFTFYCMAHCLLTFLEKILPINGSVLHLIVFLIFALLQAVQYARLELGKVKPKSLFLLFISALVKLGIDLIRAICAWALAGTLRLFLTSQNTGAFIVGVFIIFFVCFAFFFLELIEKYTTGEWNKWAKKVLRNG